MDLRVNEFHCIMPIANMASVLKHGILSHERVAALPHLSVALQQVQERRDIKQVPGGLKVHQYANLYFHARNPMMFKRKEQAEELCVLRIGLEVLKVKGVVITDCNASSDWVRFLAPSQAKILDFDDIYARDWRHPNDSPAYYRHRSRKCAEVLVPHRVESRFLTGAYVVNKKAAAVMAQTGFNLPISVDADLFFQ
jgi:hypothetical protein